MANGFTRRKEQSKEEIRKAAWALFSQFGVEKVSVNDIARKAGVSHATIYNNFGSKDALVREFVATVVEQLMGSVEAVLTPDRPYWEKMAVFIQFITRSVAQETPLMANRAILTSRLNGQDDPEMQKIRASAQARMTVMLMNLVREGKEQGKISPSLSDEAISIYFQAFMDLFSDPQLQHRFYTDPKLAQDLSALMINGLSASM